MRMRVRLQLEVAILALLLAALASAGVRAQSNVADQRAKALALVKQHQYLEALPLLEDLFQKNQTDTGVLEALAESLLAHAATLSDQEAAGEDRVRAKQLIDSAIQLGDESQLAQNLADTMRNMAATGEMKFADQADVDAAMKAGEAAFAKNDFDEAIKNYSHALELDPKLYTAALFVGDSYFAAKKFPQAGEWYRRAAQIDPNRETAYRYHADMLVKQGDFAGARILSIEAVVAEPYNAKTWRALIAWANASRVQLQRMHIETGGGANAAGDGKITIAIQPNQPTGVSAVWLAYSMQRALWQGDKFKKELPKETQYRHSLAEQAASLTSAAKVAEELKGKQDSKAIAADPNIQLMLRLYHAQMIEPDVLMNSADQGIAQDYPAYREKNRAKLIEYLADFVAPETEKK
jgi:tetratricopeptide (TPR) repeat protein